MADDGASSSAAALPIRQHTDAIVKAVRANQVVVVIGETGSGKTTQLSQVRISWGRAGKRFAICLVCLTRSYLLTFTSSIHQQILLEAGLAQDGVIAVTQPRRVVRIKRGEGRRLRCIIVVVVAPPRDLRLPPPRPPLNAKAKRRRPDKRTIPKPTQQNTHRPP
jgi:hypothetical protein